ncbi:hypothetical protein FG386_002025 [Cryptosporidium ryanae]|uniref:uncharacterized protein n=1 Tax=Cryptosporidium ryanae TaxID=515981 RepID=UPI00351A705C|nr:hypothetical protein FG386_002025 [Cryptosporidium ryanae]
MFSKLNLRLLTIFLIFKKVFTWILNFDLIPNSESNFFPLELERCKMSYWTSYNTECMDGCTIFGELRYGPNYLSGNSVIEIPRSIGINCEMDNKGKMDVFDKFEIFGLWVDTDICSLEFQSIFDIIQKKAVMNTKLSKYGLFNKNTIKILHLDNYNKEEITYIGAFNVNSLNNLLRYREYTRSYIKYSIIIDLLLFLLLLLNTLLYKYRLHKIKKIKEK